MKLFIKLSLMFGLITSVFANQAQEFVVGFAVGGPSDTIARTLIKNKLSSSYIVLNKPGAGGQLAIKEMQEKKTISLAVLENIFVANKTIYKEKLNYNPDNIEIIGLVASTPLLIACRRDLNFKTIDGLMNYKKDLTFALVSVGGVEDMASRLLFAKIKKEHQIVYYSAGGNKPLLDLLGGHVDCYFSNLPTLSPYLNSDKLDLLISSQDISFTGKKVPVWGDIFKEKFPIQFTLALVVDKSLPSPQKDKFINDFQNELVSEELRKDMLNKGSIPIGIFGEAAKIEGEKILKQHQKVFNELDIKF
jgi:tripartite-type tricarboxylate transporter receptor subunit TctC